MVHRFYFWKTTLGTSAEIDQLLPLIAIAVLETAPLW
jgi:hypothetical protein